jgi:glycerol-3-phosphate O-acyltransferase / dihydroxyacetone phosphate acyltransferase
MVLSDTDLQVKSPGIKEADISPKEYAYKVIPKLDQTHVYESVISRLINGQSIGIFPEGGSHDRSEMLPIKAGVSIMALGAMSRDPNCKISIIACGLKYFKPHRFRSQVIVEFSTPYRIPTDLVEKYKTNKRAACGEMLVSVEKKMREVTLNAPSYKELKQIYMAREIYMPERMERKTSENG